MVNLLLSGISYNVLNFVSSCCILPLWIPSRSISPFKITAINTSALNPDRNYSPLMSYQCAKVSHHAYYVTSNYIFKTPIASNEKIFWLFLTNDVQTKTRNFDLKCHRINLNAHFKILKTRSNKHVHVLWDFKHWYMLMSHFVWFM